jgi:hypothetical protein
LDWWEHAEYSVCFSESLKGKQTKVTSSYERVCNEGKLLGTNAAFSSADFRALSGYQVDQMVVLSPTRSGDDVVVQVDVIVQVFGSRSLLGPNVTLTFRASCGKVVPKIAEWFSNWYLAVSRGDFNERVSFTAVSHDNRIWMLGGELKAYPQVNEIWTSSFDGISSWKQLSANFASWPARYNLTAVVHNDAMYVMGGAMWDSQRGETCFNDVWVYADDVALEKYYKTITVPSPDVPKGASYAPYWIEVTRDSPGKSAPWRPRANAYALSFLGRVWLIGGREATNRERTQHRHMTDVWSSADLRTWRLDHSVAPWAGRNNVFAQVYNKAIYVVASVQSQHYNTWYSYDGVKYQIRESACALSHVDVIAMISFNGFLMAFTIGCHNQLTYDQIAVNCDHPYAGLLENRIYFTEDGTSWHLTMQPFTVNLWDQPVPTPYSWSQITAGELRYNMKVCPENLFVLYTVMSGQKNECVWIHACVLLTIYPSINLNASYFRSI